MLHIFSLSELIHSFKPFLIISVTLELLSFDEIEVSFILVPGSGNSPKFGGKTKGAFFSTKNSSLPFFLVAPIP